jgi:hypothetical protein
MFALLSPRLWIALALVAVLAFTHGMAYRSGKAIVRASWDAEKVVAQKATIAAEKASREKELALQHTKDEAVNAAAVREKNLRAALAAARVAGDGLRNDLTAARGDLSRASIGSIRAYTATLGAVFAECSAEVERLGGEAQGHASDSLMLQQAWPR